MALKKKEMLPISIKDLDKAIEKVGIQFLSTATIRQIVSLSKELEKESDSDFIHLELGNPGLQAEKIGVEAECAALRSGVANRYPDIQGLKELKEAGSKFIKAFLDLNIPPKCIIPTVGSMQASYTLMTLLKQIDAKKDTILFFYPGFPAQTHQAKMLGLNCMSFDIYEFRGEKMRAKLEELLSSGRIFAMLYSNPNNPSWTNLTKNELQIIGDLATKYDTVVIEDLAYMGMDFREDYSKPYEPPYVPTVGKYTDKYILLVSASKIFSYAGQRIAVIGISPTVYESKYPILEKFYEMPNFGESYIYGVLYTASSGSAFSAQYALATMFEMAAKGELNFVSHCRDYATRSKRMKDSFLNNGFHIVYEKDGKEDISDGFFFTLGYKNLTGEELQKELLRYGISSISLKSTGSTKEGIRVCVSLMKNEEDFALLNERLKLFNDDHKR